MAAGRIVLPGWMPALDSNGAPIPNAQIYLYLNGTTTLATVYSDDALATPIANPVEANSSGQFPEIWADDANLFSISVDAPYGPPGIPFTFDSIGPATASAVIEVATDAGTAAANVVVAGKANVALDNVGGSAFGGKAFQVASRPVSAPLVSRFANMIDLSADYGVVADGVEPNQQTKINQAIAESLTSSRPLRLRLPPGQIRTDAGLSAITGPIILEGDTERATQLRPVGNFNAVTIGTGSSRVSNAGLRNVGFNAAGMTGGYCVYVDWTQNPILENLLVGDPWNGFYVRQSGRVTLNNVLVDPARGLIAFRGEGPAQGGFDKNVTSGLRNGELDKIDRLSFNNVVMQSNYDPATSSVPTTRLIDLDGWVHTVQFANTALLSARSGLRTLNTYGLPQKYAPSFLWGKIETENTYEHGINLISCNDVEFEKAFTASSKIESGLEVGANAQDVEVHLTSQNNSKFGMYVAPGAKNISLHEPAIERNNQGNLNLAGVEDGSGALRVYGGRIGGGVSETQTYGLKGVTGTKAFDVDLSGNVTAPTNGDIQAIRCLPNGAGRQPSVTVSVGASPFTYTVGPRDVSVALYGGSGVTATIDGVFQVKSSPGNFLAPAGSQVVVSYGTLPDMAVTPI